MDGITIRQLEDLFRKAVLLCLDLPDDGSAKDRVRIQWPTEGAPAFPVDRDVAFVGVTPLAGDNVTRHRIISWTPSGKGTADYRESALRPVSVSLIFYGPNAYEDAWTVSRRIGMPSAHDFLRRGGVALLTGNPDPVRVPELHQQQWWERADLTLEANTVATAAETIGTIETLGEMTLGTGGAGFVEIGKEA